MAADPAAELLGQVAALDETLRDRVIKLAHKSLDEAEYMIMHGDPRMKAALMRSFMQTFSKYLSAKEHNDELDEIKKSVIELREAVLGRSLAPEPTEVGDAEADKPDV